jgi:RNA polymerase sigma-70 factor (ECF subfamily)
LAERQGFAEFCRVEWPRLVGSLFLSTGDRALAEDLAQETLARAFANWRRVSKLEAPGGWAHRVSLNLLRSHARHLRVATEAHPRLVTPVPPPVDPGDAVAVRAELLRLPERQRIAVVMRYFADLSVRETAAAMRCPEGTVKTLTYEAIAALRRTGLLPDSLEEDVV